MTSASDGKAPWWQGIPPLTAPVECDGKQHHLQWSGGHVRLPDHADAERERTLGALAGSRPRCIDLLDAWHRHREDPRVLVLASRGVHDSLAAEEPGGVAVFGRRGRARGGMMRTSGRSAAGWTAYAPLGPGPRPGVRHGSAARIAVPGSVPPGMPPDPDADLTDLLMLGPGWSERLTATVVASLLERASAEPDGHAGRPGAPTPHGSGSPQAGSSSTQALLHAALYGRGLTAVRAWCGRPDLEIDLQVVDDPELAAIDPTADPVQIALPLRWLLDVWARGVVFLVGGLCLSADLLGENTLRLRSASPSGGRPTTLTLTLPPSTESG